MAERGAHMTATSHIRPSIFELLAQESLASNIHPSCRQLADFLVARNPEKIGWLSGWFEEAYFILDLIVQYHYLKKHGASFSENFYGLMRVPNVPGKLTSRHLRTSVFNLVILKYLRIKLEQWINKRKYELESSDYSGGWRIRLEKIVLQVHGLLHAAWESICVLQILSYMSGTASSHSPLLSLAQLTLTNSSSESESEWHWKNIWKHEFCGKLRFPVLIASVFGNILGHSLEMGAFFLQFLHWWNQEGGTATLGELPIPPPPQLDLGENTAFLGKCPLCLGPRRIETVLPVSGYVFCFRCIFTYVREKGRCPVTKYPASLDDLIRVYADANENS